MWERAMKWLHVAVLFVFLNFLWLFGSLLGMIVFGFIPSTIAVLKLLTLPGVFNNENGYGKLVFSYFRELRTAFKHSKVLLFIPVLIEIIILLELQFIKHVPELQAIFQIPLTFLLIYVFFIIFHVSYLANKIDLVTMKESKMLLLSPLIFSKSSLMILVVVVSLSVIAMVKGWMMMVIFSLTIYTAYQLVHQDYKSKGW